MALVNKIVNFICSRDNVTSSEGSKMRPYLKLCAKLSGHAFGLGDIQRALDTSRGAAKVVVSRLKRDGQLITLERGRYRLVGRESLAKLQELESMDPNFHRLAEEVYRRYPDLSAVVFYGSRIAGSADEFSDYDVLVVTRESHEWTETRRVEQELRGELSVGAHLTVYSEKTFRLLVITEPHLKFWMNNSVVLTEGHELGVLPPTAKWGYTEALYLAEGYIDVGNMGGRGQVISYLTALRMILMVEHSIGLDYDYENVRKEVERLVGGRLIRATRANPLSPNVRKEETVQLRRRVRKRLREARSKLDLIGENESDLKWMELRR